MKGITQSNVTAHSASGWSSHQHCQHVLEHHAEHQAMPVAMWAAQLA